MPKYKYFESGKYGEVNPWEQASRIQDLNKYLGMNNENPKLFSKVNDIINTVSVNVRNPKKEISSVSKYLSLSSARPYDTEKLYNALKESNKYYKNILKKPERKMQPFLGFARFIETVSNPDKGNFSEAVYDNYYMEQFIAQTVKLYVINSAKNGIKQTAEYLAGPDGLGQNIAVFDDYFDTIGKLINSEYEKKALLDDYNQEKEQQYLNNLSANIKKMVDVYEKLSSFVDENGNCQYDHCFSDPLATVVGKGDLTDNVIIRRSIVSSIDNIKGQQQAIENGWGAGELEVLGSMNQILGDIQREILISEANYNRKLENQDDIIAEQRENLLENQRLLDELLEKGAPILKEEDKDNKEKKDAFERKLEEYNNDVQRYQKHVQMYSSRIENYSKELENSRNLIGKLREAQNEINSIKEEAWEKKNPSTIDKFMITRKFTKFLDKYSYKNSPLEKECPKYRRVLDKAAQYGFGKPVMKDNSLKEESLLQKEDYEKYNKLFLARKNYLKPIIVSTSHKSDYTDDEDVVYDLLTNAEQDYLPNVLTGSLCPAKDPEVKFIVPPGTSEQLDEKLRKYNMWAQETIAKSSSAIKSFNVYSKIMAMAGDGDRGNIMEIIGEHAFMDPLMTNISGAGPEIFKDINDNSGIKPEHVREYFQTTGVKRPIMGFFDGAAEYMEALFGKQKDMKVGWNALKETRHLARLEQAFDKMISEFEQLEKFPDETQKNNSPKVYGNSLGHLTGHGGADINRGITRYVDGLRWMKQGIHNGWGSRDLEVLNLMGIFEGSLNKRKYEAQFKGEMDKLAQLKDWEEKNFKPVKETLLNMKIKSPSDVLEALCIIEDFQQKAKNDEFVKDICANSLDIGDKGFITRCSNACIEDVKKGKSLYYGENFKKEDIFKKADYSDSMKNTADTIRNNKNLPENELKQMVASYIRSYYMNGKNIHSNPELFSPQNNYYNVVDKKLKTECAKYSEELINSLKNKEGTLPSANEIADILEFGDHRPHMSDIKDRIDASIAASRINSFTQGKPESKENDKTVSEVLKVMEKADEGVFTTNTRFSDVMDNLKSLDKMRQVFRDQLSEKYKNNLSMKIDDKNLKKYLDLQNDTYKIIQSYLNDKNNKIIKKKGKPSRNADIDKLGVNGAKRYRAMLEAQKTIENLYKVTRDFESKGFTDTQRVVKNHTKEGFKIDGENMKQDMLREKYRLLDNKAREMVLNEEKYRINEAEAYQRLKDQRTKDLAESKITQEEYDNYQKQDKEQYDNKILNSAKKTIFIESVRNTSINQANENYYNKAAYEKSIPAIKDFENAIKNISLENNNGISFNENSDQFKKFNDLMFKEGNTFGENFKDAVLSSNKVPNHSDIVKLRDNSLQKSIDNAVTDNDKKVYQDFVKIIGKGENEASYGAFKKQKEAEKAEIEKNKQNNKQNENAQQKLPG